MARKKDFNGSAIKIRNGKRENGIHKYRISQKSKTTGGVITTYSDSLVSIKTVGSRVKKQGNSYKISKINPATGRFKKVSKSGY